MDTGGRRCVFTMRLCRRVVLVTRTRDDGMRMLTASEGIGHRFRMPRVGMDVLRLVLLVFQCSGLNSCIPSSILLYVLLRYSRASVSSKQEHTSLLFFFSYCSFRNTSHSSLLIFFGAHAIFGVISHDPMTANHHHHLGTVASPHQAVRVTMSFGSIRAVMSRSCHWWKRARRGAVAVFIRPTATDAVFSTII